MRLPSARLDLNAMQWSNAAPQEQLLKNGYDEPGNAPTGMNAVGVNAVRGQALICTTSYGSDEFNIALGLRRGSRHDLDREI
jgi:hypothetical protein